jgi:DNA-directed RNA polymerase specialized sigma24 family protein
LDQQTPKPTRAAALGDLTPDQRKKLVVQSRLKARPPVFGAEDLLQGAYERWLKSDLAIEGPEETYDFLWGAINSIAFNATRHKRIVRRFEGERAVAIDGNDPIELAHDVTVSQEDAVLAEQLYSLCAHDEDLQMLLMCQNDRATKAETLGELGWDEKKYETVQKRKKRLVKKWINEGIL